MCDHAELKQLVREFRCSLVAAHRKATDFRNKGYLGYMISECDRVLAGKPDNHGEPGHGRVYPEEKIYVSE